MEDKNLAQAYENYFSVVNSDNKKETEKEEVVPKKPSRKVYTAEGNISDIDEFAEILRTILDAAWGTEWGELKPEMSKDTNVSTLRVPVITYDVNSREVADKTPIKPILFNTEQEMKNGVPTGDSISYYRQWFDCIIEFNVWGRNSLEVRKILNNLELILNSYAGFLKKSGISEMFFLKEIPSNKSVNYIPGLPMKSMMYFIRIERIQKVKQSVIKNIDVAVNELLERNKINNEELNEDTYDNAVDIYKNNKINYEL